MFVRFAGREFWFPPRFLSSDGVRVPCSVIFSNSAFIDLTALILLENELSWIMTTVYCRAALLLKLVSYLTKFATSTVLLN